MKTFTTYAEKKAKQFLNLLQGYTKGIRLTATLILLLMGVNNAWADITFTGGYIYFDNSIGINQTYIQLCARQGSWTGVSTMTNISNTKLYYVANPQGSGWGGILGWVVIGNSSQKTNNNFDNWSTYGWCSNWNTFDFYSGSTYLIVPTSTSKSQSVNTSYLSGGYSALNSQQTIKSAVNDADANSKATISITSYKMTDNGKVTEQTATLGTGAKDTYVDAARTATTTLTVGDVATGYQFDGWYTAATGGTQLEADETYTYYPTAATTVYARFSTKQHTVNFKVHSSGHGSLTAKVEDRSINYGDKVSYGSEVVFTAKPDDGYQIEGWYSNSACTEPIDNGTNKTYTVTIKGGTNVYVKFVEIPVNSHNITYTAQGTGWTYGNSNPTTAEEGATVTFVVNPTAGYRVDVSSDGPAITGPNANNQYTFTMPTKDVKITVDAKPEQYTVTLNQQSGTGGPSSVTATYLAAMPTITPPTRIGYTFNGYFDATSGGTKYYNADGSSAKNWDKTSNTTLYARWTAKQYTITYKDQNNATFSGTHANGYPTKHTYGTATTLKTATKTGYTFDGWFTTSACTGTAVTSLGATDYTSNITLYAKWTELPPTTIYIKSDGNYADFKWNYNSTAYPMDKVDCDGTYYTADILGGVEEITLTGSNNFTTTTLTVPTDDKKLYDLTSTTHLYLKPNSNWTQSNARFAAYFFGDGEEWVNMTAVTGQSGLYEVTIPTGKSYTSVIFCRMNPSSNTNGWTQDTQLWNQTNDLNIPTDGKNQYAVAAGAWSKGSGTWSAIYDNNRWTTFEAPTLNVQVNITGKGSIVIDGETYTSITTGTETFAFTKASGENIAVGAITPAERWAYNKDAKIEMCDEEKDLATSHTITGPAVITLSFTQESCEVVFNLNLPKGVIIPNWTINNQYILPNDTVVKPTVGEINGYLFGGWYTTGEYSDATLYNFGTPVTKDIELYARWVPYEQCIFFKNNLNWDKIYVYTFKGDVWGNDGKGVHPANRYEYGKMTQIGYTDVYYYILTKSDGFNYIAFSDNNMSDYNEFYGNNAIYRGDRNDNMQLFIPQRDQDSETHNNTKYYSKGIWMKYNSTESGYKWSSDKNGWSTDINPFTAPNKGGYSFTTKVSLEGGTKYFFKINNIKNDWFGRTGTMTQDDCTDWWFKTEEDNATIQPNATGEYLFTIYLGDGKVMVSLEYPLGIGDYRLAYKDNTANSFHPGHYIRKRSTTGPHRDTTSFFIFHDKTPIILLQQCTKIEPETGEVTWETLKRYACTGNNTTDDNPNNAMLPGKKNADGELLISGSSCGVDQTTVYNFVLLQEDGNDANLATSETHLYTGDFYIRTDAAPGGWDYFRQADNLMTSSSYAQQHEHFDHYFCKWIHKDKNVRYTVANDYSYCISDTLFADDIIGGNDGTIEVLPVNANVRFMWDSRDNSIGRAYIAGSSDQADRFLVVVGKDNNLKDAAGNDLIEGQHDTNRYGLHAYEEILKDMGNWIYQVDVKANKDALIKLTALYNGTTQYFKGTEGKEDSAYIRLLASDATDTYKIRLIYDFKVNQLIIAWLVDNEDIEENMVLGADMMIIRHNQGRATQINFNNATDTIKNVEKAYAVMTFDKYFLNNLILNDPKNTLLPENERLSQYARALYWISFPFDVRLSDVSGFGEYGDYWILEYYDGADRAKNGLWADTDTYWKYITNPNYIIQAGQGYVLSLNLNKMGSASTIWANTAEVSLFFPSTGSLNTITGELPTAVDVPAYECTIERENGIHKIYDSHWNMIGVPGFADIENVPVGDNLFNEERKLIEQEEVTFYYQYVPEDNTYDAKSKNSENFQIMYSYMVQYCGTINWTTPAFSVPSAIAARSASSMPSEYNMLLELASSNNTADQTYIKLQEERATVDFDLNLDLTKIMNHGENIYTLTGSQEIKCAGNTLPIQRLTVPVGVRVDVAGEYTFRMPDGTDGISAILVDNQTGAHTNMLLDEYTVILEAGTYENRFSLVLDPQRTSTEVENIGDGYGDGVNGNGAEGIKKYIIDGQLFIRTANGLFDAKGQRM